MKLKSDQSKSIGNSDSKSKLVIKHEGRSMTTLDKIKDLVAKRQDFAARFDEVTKKTNTKTKQKCSKLL